MASSLAAEAKEANKAQAKAKGKKKKAKAAAADQGQEKPTGKKKTTKRQAAAAAKEVKKSKEAKAVARAGAKAAKRSAAKEVGRVRVVEAEKTGAAAREHALALLQQKQRSTGKRKASPSSGPTKKKKKKSTSPLAPDQEDDGDADDERVASLTPVERAPPLPASLPTTTSSTPAEAPTAASGSTPAPADHSTADEAQHQRSNRWRMTKHHQLQSVLELHGITLSSALHDAASSITTSAAPTGASTAELESANVEGLDSDMEGEGADSEEWYIETGSVADAVSEAARSRQDQAGAVEDWSSGEDDSDGLDGEALIARESRKLARNLAKERLKEAVGKLPRDWKTTTKQWCTLTKDEMLVLAQDEDALKKMRVDGWDFGKYC
ncbi:hypothetical protein PR002_g23705 [Phytophthora rubi]|uniref:Uncharacterized protein n=1 Tax=Phytophthora rubi TaxID=129364 RepID=A0A6A3INW5_9STRA|nr:hypothetical protein PR002_g23705 [Phytophthora rubi]